MYGVQRDHSRADVAAVGMRTAVFRAGKRVSEDPVSPTVAVQLQRSGLNLAWCAFPATLPAAVMVHAYSGAGISDRAWAWFAVLIVTGLTVIGTAARARSQLDKAPTEPHPVSTLAFVAALGTHLAVFASHPTVFGANDTLAGATIQVNVAVIGLLCHTLLFCTVPWAEQVVVVSYMGPAFFGPVLPEIGKPMRLAMMGLLGVVLMAFGRSQRSVLQRSFVLADQNAALVSELSITNERLAQLALQDELTGLLNRRGWGQAAEDRLPSVSLPATAGLIYVDIDRFKTINDTFGHHEGDHVLQEVAATLTASLRPGDVVARLGGDEFAALVNVRDEKDLESLHRRLREGLAEAGQRAAVQWSASSGATIIEGTDDLRSAAIRADAALYRNKVHEGARRQIV